MIVNDKEIKAYEIRLDAFTTLHIAHGRKKCVDVPVAMMDTRFLAACAEFNGVMCPVKFFNNAGEIWCHYHIHDTEIRNTIWRIIDFIDSNL